MEVYSTGMRKVDSFPSGAEREPVRTFDPRAVANEMNEGTLRMIAAVLGQNVHRVSKEDLDAFGHIIDEIEGEMPATAIHRQDVA